MNDIKKQHGISLIGLLFVGSILAFIVIVTARVVPSVTEYISIVKAVKKAAVAGSTVKDIRDAFDRTAAVNYINSINGRDLEITKNGGNVVIYFSYDKEIPLFGPAYLLIKYRGSSNSDYY